MTTEQTALAALVLGSLIVASAFTGGAGTTAFLTDSETVVASFTVGNSPDGVTTVEAIGRGGGLGQAGNAPTDQPHQSANRGRDDQNGSETAIESVETATDDGGEPTEPGTPVEPVPTATDTPDEATETVTPEPTDTPTGTTTAEATPTPTRSDTATLTPTPTDTSTPAPTDTATPTATTTADQQTNTETPAETTTSGD